MEALSATSSLPSFLGTRRGKLTLALVSAVAFIDLLDASIVNVALPQIQTHLHSSVQSLQWVASAYLLTYGGFLLLGGRAADLLGRIHTKWGMYAAPRCTGSGPSSRQIRASVAALKAASAVGCVQPRHRPREAVTLVGVGGRR
jgi:MFS family permease